MLDEFPALGRLDFFESALAFMAGYGLKSFLIAQSLNQIEKAYGQNNSILDNCHVRVSFATNDERTAKRVSDALGTATEMRAMKNYAGHRLSPWLGHLMVSRQETARPLLTPGEVMQLPPDDELVLVSGCHPIRAKKARYYEDPRAEGADPAAADAFRPRCPVRSGSGSEPHLKATGLTPPSRCRQRAPTEDPANAGIRREPELPEHEEIAPEPRKAVHEFEPMEDEPDDEPQRQRVIRRAMRERGPPGLASIRPTTWGCKPPCGPSTPSACRPISPASSADYAARKGVPQSLVVEAALASHLSPDGADRLEAALARRLDRMTRQIERLERHVDISNEALAVFVRFWLTSTPPLPDTALPAAQAKGRERYEGFVEALGRRLARGRKLADEIVRDVERRTGASEFRRRNALT